MLPKEYPKRQTVYYYFRKWRESELFAALNRSLRKRVRVASGKDENPSAAIIDSQSVKTDEQAKSKGCDAGKKVKGRKRHILVDTVGLLLIAKVLTADIQDRDGAKLLFLAVKEQMPRLQLIWADGGYRGKLIKWAAIKCLWVLDTCASCYPTSQGWQDGGIIGYVFTEGYPEVTRYRLYSCNNRYHFTSYPEPPDIVYPTNCTLRADHFAGFVHTR